MRSYFTVDGNVLANVLLLVVDDDFNIRSHLEEGLIDSGFEILLVEDGDEAIRALDREQDKIKGLITDVNLGGGPEGWDVARHAREIQHDIPIVYMTGASSNEWSSHGVPNSILVTKPFALAQIVTAISGLLNDVHHG